MPTIIFTNTFDCGPSVTGASIRKVKNLYDATGTGQLIWDLDNGDLPSDLNNYFDVFQNGKRLEYPAEYTVNEFITANTSRINIINPIPMTYYTLIKYV
jgi:hypothetical protein